MQYALLLYETPKQMARRDDPAEADYWAGWKAYFDVLNEADVIVAGKPLEPGETKTLVRAGPSGREIEDGPFPDVREELGGFVVIEAEDIDRAIAFAEGAPCCKNGGHVEVRPVRMRQKETA